MADDMTCKAVAAVDRTTKGHADDAYEHLLSAHSTLDTIWSHLYGEDSDGVTQPQQPGLHSALAENARLASLLRNRLDRLYERL